MTLYSTIAQIFEIEASKALMGRLSIMHCELMSYCSRLQMEKRMQNLGHSTFIFIIKYKP
jgi:hypothetical protein